MRARFALLAATLALAALSTVGALSAGAEPAEVTVTKVGWWSDRVGANEAGEGAFEVAISPTGELQSIAAFELDIDAEAVQSANIVLAETAGLAEFSTLRLCPTADEWEAADPGELDDAPTPDCSDSVSLTRTIDSMVWLGDITTLVRDGGTVSLMVVPEHNPPTPISPGMLVRVDTITLEAEAAEAGAITTSTTLDFTTPGGGNTFDPVPDSGLSVDFGGTGTVGVDIPGASTPAIDDLGTVEDEPAPDAATDEEFFALEPIDAESGPPKPWGRLLLLVPLSAATGLGAAFARRWVESRSQAVVT